MTTKQAGVLLHPTSLPSGKLDHQAWLFLDWMEQAKLSVWQMLPLTEPVQGLSPYQSVSAFAMNPALLPNNWQEEVDESGFAEFVKTPPHWLDDYALFMTLRQHYQQASWNTWPEEYRRRDAAALAQFAEQQSAELTELKKQQFALLTIWSKLKKDANAKGIQLFGDMPIFVAYDSADVWANPNEFKLDEDFNPTVVAGVPPDYFSETGQRWGNPHYDWEAMQQDGFAWWNRRVQDALALFDLIRIDHFRGLEACWEIPADEDTAMNGRWKKVPGLALLEGLKSHFSPLPVVAEDLGIITPEVVALKQAFDLPGMSVLQFGFSGLPDNPHSLDEQVETSVVYTGTHDNDTTLGWWEEMDDPGHKDWILSQLPQDVGDMPWPLIAAAFASVAQLAMVPMQDFLALNGEHRMNVPGTVEGNWAWQFDWTQVTPETTQTIAKLVEHSQRMSKNS